jgi:Leucine-rich repeat (LRR) protein
VAHTLIPDPALETAIRNTLGKASGLITETDLLSISTLKADNCGVQSIEGLQYCENLTDLDLHDNNIADIQPLAHLDKLQYLKLQHNAVSDLSPIGNLKALEGLMLRFNAISDITPLQYLPALKYLYLDANDISSIRPLVDNTDFAQGDRLSIALNPLDSESVDVLLPALRNRGVDIINE